MGNSRRRFEELVKAAAQKTPKQLIGILDRKARNRLVPRLPVDFDNRYRAQIPSVLTYNTQPYEVDTTRLREALDTSEQDRYRKLATDFTDGQVTFLNRTRELPITRSISPADDRIAGLPRLWYLKLAAFEPVRWSVLGYDEPAASSDVAPVVETWLQAHVHTEPIASRVGYLRGFWTPYSVSLRIKTLSRYAGWADGIEDQLIKFLYKNLLFLENNIEHDVDGNHLFENGAALILGGAGFAENGDRFVDTGLKLLRTAVDSQFFDDGYHYERSPMYHLAVTTCLVSSVSILQQTDRKVPDWLYRSTARASTFISYLRPPDGRIPLLNDSVFDETERLDTIIQYASSVGIEPDSVNDPGESDLYWQTSDGVTALFDAGDSGPEQQLGHTHNDPCTVLVWHGKARLITDTGTFDYQAGERRQIARSVTHHNTVSVNDEEPVGFGGRFRMTSAVNTAVTQTSSETVSAVAARYQAGGQRRYSHRRTCFEGPSWYLIWDNVETDVPTRTSRLHAHPRVSIEDDDSLRFVHESGPQIAVQPFGVESERVRTAPYFPRYGEELDREVLCLRSRTPNFGYLITPRQEEASLDRKDGKPTVLHVDSEDYRLPEVQL